MQIKEFSNEIIGEKYTCAILENGLKIYILEKPEFSSAYAVFGTRYGSIDTAFSVNSGELTEVPEGIAHFLEHKLFESEDGDAFTKYAKTGAYANAYTSFDRTCYLFTCSDLFEENLGILLDFVQSPYFTEATVNKEQGIIGQEIRMYDDSPEWCVFFNLLKGMYHINPVKIDIAGTTETIAQINADLLYKCYETFYNPSNMFVCIAGNVDTVKTLKRIEAAVTKNEPKDITRKVFPEPAQPVTQYIETALDVAKPIFSYGYKIPTDSEPSLRDTICINLLLDVMASDISPLYEKLTDMGLINDDFDTEFFNGRGYAAAVFSGESSNPKKVVQTISEYIEKLKSEGIGDEIFEASRKNAYGDILKRYNSVEDIASTFVDAAVSDYDVFEEIEIIRRLKISDIEKYLDIFDEKQSVLSVVNPRKEEVK
ncbi:MAG: insulinase family protein [Clostridiales bacterium]|nr:insulinase family protein [Candidatus Equinaster intestinalis]